MDKTENPRGRPMTAEEMADFEKDVVQGEEAVPTGGTQAAVNGPGRPMTPEEMADFEEHVIQHEDDSKPERELPHAPPLPSPD
jgi:hypothetical protein